MMAGYIGKIDTFENTTDDWNIYCERLEQYFEANDIKDEKRANAPELHGRKSRKLIKESDCPT